MPRKTILLSEAADILAAIEASFLSRDRFLLIRSRRGDKILAMAEENDPSLIVLDLDLPGMSECHRNLRADPLLRETPVLLVSSSDPPDDGADAEAILFRPLSRPSFLERTCRLLGIAMRAAPRLPADLPVLYGPTPAKLKPGRVADINTGGVYLWAGHLYPAGTEIYFSLTLAPGSELRGRGRVAWVNHPEWRKKSSLQPGMGIQFIDLEGDGAERLQEWVRAASGA